MSETGKPTAVKDAQAFPIGLPITSADGEGENQIAAFVARRAEIARSDHEAFQDYLREKRASAARATHN